MYESAGFKDKENNNSIRNTNHLKGFLIKTGSKRQALFDLNKNLQPEKIFKYSSKPLDEIVNKPLKVKHEIFQTIIQKNESKQSYSRSGSVGEFNSNETSKHKNRRRIQSVNTSTNFSGTSYDSVRSFSTCVALSCEDKIVQLETNLHCNYNKKKLNRCHSTDTIHINTEVRCHFNLDSPTHKCTKKGNRGYVTKTVDFENIEPPKRHLKETNKDLNVQHQFKPFSNQDTDEKSCAVSHEELTESKELSNKSSVNIENLRSQGDKITFRLSDISSIPDPSGFISNCFAQENENIFVDGKQHYINYTSPDNQLVLNDLCSQNVLHEQDTEPQIIFHQPLKKATIRKKLDERCYFLVKDYLPHKIYLKDMYMNMKDTEHKFVLRKHFMNIHGNSISFRSKIVNWLLKLQQYMPTSGAVFMISVKLMDRILAEQAISLKNYQLLAATCLWIAMKFDNNDVVISVTKLYGLCGGLYTKTDILKMEHFVLKSVKFHISTIEPLSFLHYYLICLNMENKEAILYAAQYVLEAYTLFPNYSSSLPSLLAASALHLALETLNEETFYFIKLIKDDLGFQLCETKQTVTEMKHSISLMCDNEDIREPFIKYSSKKYFEVSTLFQHK